MGCGHWDASCPHLIQGGRPQTRRGPRRHPRSPVTPFNGGLQARFLRGSLPRRKDSTPVSLGVLGGQGQPRWWGAALGRPAPPCPHPAGLSLSTLWVGVGQGWGGWETRGHPGPAGLRERLRTGRGGLLRYIRGDERPGRPLPFMEAAGLGARPRQSGGGRLQDWATLDLGHPRRTPSLGQSQLPSPLQSWLQPRSHLHQDAEGQALHPHHSGPLWGPADTPFSAHSSSPRATVWRPRPCCGENPEQEPFHILYPTLPQPWEVGLGFVSIRSGGSGKLGLD